MSDLNGNAAVIEKIQKLLALSGSPNENEAALAAEKAGELLAKHNLTMSEVEGSKELNNLLLDNDFFTDRAAWVRPFLNQLAQLYFCGYFYTTVHKFWVTPEKAKDARRLVAGGRATAYLQHSFVGAKHNVVVVKVMAEYLITAMERLCREGEARIARDERISYRVSFMNTCAARLCNRLALKRAKPVDPSVPGSNLPALLSLYEQADKAFEEWKQDNAPGMKAKKNLARTKHLEGYRDGKAAGDKISLDDQIKGQSHLRLAVNNQ